MKLHTLRYSRIKGFAFFHNAHNPIQRTIIPRAWLDVVKRSVCIRLSRPLEIRGKQWLAITRCKVALSCGHLHALNEHATCHTERRSAARGGGGGGEGARGQQKPPPLSPPCFAN